VLLSLVYRLVRCLFGLLAVLVRSDLSKDAGLLVLRHENQVLRRQLPGRLRWDHAGRLWLTAAFAEVFKSEGLEVSTTLPGTPGMNATCERVIGTLRRELPGRTLILNERYLALVLREYVAHYNGHRPHQSRRQRPPDTETQPVRDVADLRSVRRKPVVAGLINEYHHAA
jgi:transposase InsO family protein